MQPSCFYVCYMFPTLTKVSIFGIKPSTSCFHPWNQTFCILGLVAGDTVLGRVLETLEHAVVPASRSETGFAFLRLLQRLLGALPLVHVDYACDALHPLREPPLRRRPVPLRRRLLDHPRHRRPLRRRVPPPRRPQRVSPAVPVPWSSPAAAR